MKCRCLHQETCSVGFHPLFLDLNHRHSQNICGASEAHLGIDYIKNHRKALTYCIHSLNNDLYWQEVYNNHHHHNCIQHCYWHHHKSCLQSNCFRTQFQDPKKYEINFYFPQYYQMEFQTSVVGVGVVGSTPEPSRHWQTMQ